MGKRLRNRVAIVTGSGQGIGKAIAHVFANEGAKVIVTTRTAKSGQETVDEILTTSGEASLTQIDIGIADEVDTLIENTVSRYGRLDIVVHNAAIYPVHLIEELPLEVLDKTLDINLKACFYLTRRAVPHMRKQTSGRLLFTSSVTGPRVAMPGTAHYAASKGGINGFIRTAALEYAKDNITVNGIEPGYILTKAMAALGDKDELKQMEKYIPMGHMGEPEDIAYAMLFLASDQAKYITGQTIVIDGASTLPESPVVMEMLG